MTGRRSAVVAGAAAAALAAAILLAPASAAWAGEAVVTASEAEVRSAPSQAAPVIGRLHGGERLEADDRAMGEWRRVKLPDGRYGVVRDAELAVEVGPPPAGSSPAPPAPPAGAPSPPAGAPTPAGRSSMIGLMLSFMPAGTLHGTRSSGTTTTGTTVDAAFATAVAPFVDLAVSPYLTLGFSPQVILHVEAEGDAGQSATEYDFRGRLGVGRLVSPTAALFARLSPALSVIDLPQAAVSSTSTAGNPLGLLVDLSVGSEVAVALSRLLVVIELGYQVGFQSNSDGDLHTRYLHAGVGLAARL